MKSFTVMLCKMIHFQLMEILNILLIHGKDKGYEVIYCNVFVQNDTLSTDGNFKYIADTW